MGEVEDLRAEVERLKAAQEQADRERAALQQQHSRGGWWRPVVVSLLVVLIVILTPLGVVARWAHNEVADTDRYVESVAPLASDPAIQEAITDKITDEITSRLDLQKLTEEAVDALAKRLAPNLAPSLSALGGPLADAIESFIRDEVGKLVRSETFKSLWDDANREAHEQLDAVLTGKGSDLIDVSDNAVKLNLGSIIDTVKQRLADKGFTLAERLPQINAQFTLFQSDDIAKAQTAFRLLSAINTWLPIVVLVLIAAAVAIGRDRRRALIATMVAVAASMLLLGFALNTFRIVYLDALSSGVDADAAAAVYDTLVAFIRLNLRALLVLSLAVAFIAWVSGPGSAAVALRRGTGRAVGWLRSGGERAGLDTGRFGRFLGTYRTVIRGAVLGLALLVYVMADHPTGAFTLVVLGVAVLVLLIVEVLARPGPPAPTP